MAAWNPTKTPNTQLICFKLKHTHAHTHDIGNAMWPIHEQKIKIKTKLGLVRRLKKKTLLNLKKVRL